MAETYRVCNRCGASGPDVKFQSNSLRCRKCAKEIWESNRRASGEDPLKILRDKKAQRRALQRAGLPTALLNPEHAAARDKAAIRREHYAQQEAYSYGLCHVCQKPPAHTDLIGGKLARDHDHQDSGWRGVLCGRCNLALGYFKENLVSLERAEKYLAGWDAEALDKSEVFYGQRPTSKQKDPASRCEICQRSAAERGRKVLDQDHCHASGKKRGLLCNQCNCGVAFFEESAEMLRRAAHYLAYWGRAIDGGDVANNNSNSLWFATPVDHVANRALIAEVLMPTGIAAKRGHRRFTSSGEKPQTSWNDGREQTAKDPATGRWRKPKPSP